MHRVPGRIGLTALDNREHVQRDSGLRRERFQAVASLVAQITDRFAEGDLGRRRLFGRFQSQLGILLGLPLQT